jgi:hypothetical protein
VPKLPDVTPGASNHAAPESPPVGEQAALRNLVAEAIMRAQYPSYRGEPTHGQYDLADVVLAALGERASVIRGHLDQADEALRDVLDLSTGWCSPHQKGDLAAITATATAALEHVMAAMEAVPAGRRPDDASA